jgi:hypothetical protein
MMHTVMIASPSDIPRLKQVIAQWSEKNLNQSIDWNTASTFSSETHQLDLSSRTSAQAFNLAFPSMITLPTNAPKGNPRPILISSPAKRPPKETTHTKNAWKTLTFGMAPEDTTKSDTKTVTTDVSSASNIDPFDQTELDFQLTSMEDQIAAVGRRMNNLDFIDYLQAS